MTIRIQYFFPQTCFFLFFFITQNKRTLSAIRQRTLTVRCSLYLFTVHVYTHKKIVHHHYYISNLHPPTSWMGQSECLKTIIFLKIQLAYSVAWHTHTHTQTHTNARSSLPHAHTQVQHRGTSVALILREVFLHLHSTLRASSFVKLTILAMSTLHLNVLKRTNLDDEEGGWGRGREQGERDMYVISLIKCNGIWWVVQFSFQASNIWRPLCNPCLLHWVELLPCYRSLNALISKMVASQLNRGYCPRQPITDDCMSHTASLLRLYLPVDKLKLAWHS